MFDISARLLPAEARSAPTRPTDAEASTMAARASSGRSVAACRRRRRGACRACGAVFPGARPGKRDAGSATAVETLPASGTYRASRCRAAQARAAAAAQQADRADAEQRQRARLGHGVEGEARVALRRAADLEPLAAVVRRRRAVEVLLRRALSTGCRPGSCPALLALPGELPGEHVDLDRVLLVGRRG